MKYVRISSGMAVFLFLLFQQTMAQDRQILTFGGYGELHYNQVIFDANRREDPGRLDFRRFGLLAGYQFNDLVSIQSELQLSNGMASAGSDGNLSLIQAYVDLKPMQELGIRAGILPVPVGIVNKHRSPASYHGVGRTSIETWLIPATWREAGVGVYGRMDNGVSYEAYALAGLKPDGISGQNGIRGARQNGVHSSIANVGAAVRVDYRINPMFEAGVSYYFSSLNHFIQADRANRVAALADAFFNMAEAHFLLKYGQIEARGLVLYTLLTDVADLNTIYDNASGESALGGYVELACDMLPFLNPNTRQELFVFARFESYDTHFKTVQIPRNNEFLRFEYTAGFTYRPVPKVAFKADFQLLRSAGDRDIGQVNAGVGFSF